MSASTTSSTTGPRTLAAGLLVLAGPARGVLVGSALLLPTRDSRTARTGRAAGMRATGGGACGASGGQPADPGPDVRRRA
jgi:hypothetical protein